jgi:redox-sensitive bicupin YhaK (pirin superfamily)
MSSTTENKLTTPGNIPDSITLLIEPDTKDLGEFSVSRSLPDKRRQRVGPFIFWDHMGPADFPPGSGVSVRPHPHIGLATITYLFDGVIVHRDSLGYEQPITSGAVNWMTAGKGIVHSERSPADLVESGSHLHGIQAWIALPEELEETEPRFEHYPADGIPVVELPGARLTVIAGRAWGQQSPVQTSSETLYVEIDLAERGKIETPDDIDEIAIYTISGTIAVDDFDLPPRRMAILKNRTSAEIIAKSDAKFMMLGGAILPGERILWWNFVSSSRDRLNKAKRDWLEKNFDDVPGETEFIPLPKK